MMAFKQHYEISCDHKDGCDAHDQKWSHKRETAMWHFEDLGWLIFSDGDAVLCPKHSNKRPKD